MPKIGCYEIPQKHEDAVPQMQEAHNARRLACEEEAEEQGAPEITEPEALPTKDEGVWFVPASKTGRRRQGRKKTGSAPEMQGVREDAYKERISREEVRAESKGMIICHQSS